jgi:hypothetical protein
MGSSREVAIRASIVKLVAPDAAGKRLELTTGGGHGEQVASGARKRWDEWRRADGVRLTYLNWSRGA